MGFKDYLLEKKEDSEEKIMGGIIDFFTTHKKPTDDDVHKLAETLGIDKHQFEERIYALLSSFFNAGNSNKNPPKEVDEKELAMGMKVEKEHTTSDAMARRIAMDHLSELPDYYTRLKKMESEK